MHQPLQPNPSPLARRLPLLLISLYGIGTIVGAGIYVLAGKVAGESGLYTPQAFLVAAIVVSFSAHAFAKLSGRFPVSSGPAGYVDEVLGKPRLAVLVGWAIMFVGVVSAATIAHGFAGYVAPYLPIGSHATMSLLIIVLALLALWGVAEAVTVAGVFTLISLVGIGLIIAYALPEIPRYVAQHPEVISLPPWEAWPAIGFGAFLAFYAFIGFEDIVNMAEEVKKPERNLPVAIYLSLIVTVLLYFLTALALMTLLPLPTFIDSAAPFADVAHHRQGLAPWIIVLISVAAITNGALIQIIMGSRILYGMAARQLAPKLFARVWHKTHTPLPATLLMAALIWLFAMLLPITTLARTTSTVVLLLFSLMNYILLVLEWRERANNRHGFTTFRKLLIPALGLLLSLLFLLLQLWS